MTITSIGEDSTSTCRSPLTGALSSSARQHSFPISRVPCVPRQSVPMHACLSISQLMARGTYQHGGVNVQRHFEFDAREGRAAGVQRGEPWKFRQFRTNAEEWSSPMGAVDRSMEQHVKPVRFALFLARGRLGPIGMHPAKRPCHVCYNLQIDSFI
jgi:hypothetical protein